MSRPPVTRLLLVLAALLFMAGVAAAVQFVLLKSFRELEADAMSQRTEQVVRALDAELRQMRVVANDYARWDDMYDFVGSLDPSFIEENFSEKGLREMEIDGVWVFDASSQPVFSAQQDPVELRYAIPAAEALTGPVREGLDALLESSARPGSPGLLVLPQGLALATAHPIVRSDRSGPSRGVLVMLRVLRPAIVARLAEVSQLPVTLGRFGVTDPRTAAPGVSAWLDQPPGGSDRLTWSADDDRIEGYALLRGLDGRPAGWLATHTPRDIHRQGRRTAALLLGAIALLTLLALASALVMSERAARSRRRAADSEALYRAVVEQAGEGIVIADPQSHRILRSNPALTTLTGIAEEDWRAQPIDALLMPASVPLFMSRIADDTDALTGPCELELRTQGDVPRLVEFTANRLRLEDRAVLCLVFRDVSQRKQAEAVLLDQQRRLEHLANHDALTGLPNRLYLNFRLPGLIADAERERQALAICYIDVDNFKNINDSSGHDVGDEFLRAIAERLRHVVSSKDVVARISGDEFVVVSAARDPRIFDAIARRVTGHLRDPVRVNGREIPSSVSMGIAVYPQDGETAAELLRNADIALYQAKERGRDTYQFFLREMNDRVRERMRLEEAMREGLQGDQFGVEYQPVIDLRSGRIAALEALARWKHPVLGQVPPGQFIPIAEDAGLIGELGETVLRRVCLQIAAWRMDGVPVAPVAVNVSAQQLQRSNIRDRVLAICSEVGVQPRMLQIELTESALMREIDRQIAALEGLRAAGVRVSIDDFGTGYSSLSYLKHLPIDHLKIDRSFVRDMAVDANDAAIVSAIIGMARSLRLETIAEGVETSQHAMRLASLGCTMAQGFYYSPPLDAANCEKLLREIAAQGGAAFTTPRAPRVVRRT